MPETMAVSMPPNGIVIAINVSSGIDSTRKSDTLDGAIAIATANTEAVTTAAKPAPTRPPIAALFKRSPAFTFGAMRAKPRLGKRKNYNQYLVY